MRYSVLEGRHILANKDENVILKQSTHSFSGLLYNDA